MRGPRAVPVLGMAALAAGAVALSGGPPQVDGDVRGRDVPLRLAAALTPYEGCDALLRDLRSALRERVGPYGLDGPVHAYAEGATRGLEATVPAPAPAADTALPHSTTTTQVADVDEPDLVKTDGRLLVALDGPTLRVTDVRDARLRGHVALPYAATGLLLAGDRAVVLGGDQGRIPGGPRPLVEPYRPYGPDASVTVVDLTDPDAPRVAWTSTFSATTVAARTVGGTIRLVLRSGPPELPWAYPDDVTPDALDRASRANQDLAQSTTLDQWLPAVRSGAGRGEPLVACDAVARPDDLDDLSMLTVLTVDPLAAGPGTGAGTAVVGAGDTVYAEGTHLYVAGARTDLGGRPSTQVHLFDLADPVRARHLASGAVAGTLRDAYALSEATHDGALHLRVTTSVPAGTGTGTGIPDNGITDNGITVLERRGDGFVQVGRVGGLGPDEDVYAVRYLGDRAYVVTFRRIDPLHVVDLADPRNPVERGELEVPGYSTFLLPLPDDRLLGIGRMVPAGGGVAPCPAGADCAAVAPVPELGQVGLQISLFDVADPARPALLARQVLPGRSSIAESDPHALTYWPAANLVALPAGDHLLTLQPLGDQPSLAVAEHAMPALAVPQRAVVAGERLFAVTDRGVQVLRLAGLSPQRWLAYP